MIKTARDAWAHGFAHVCAARNVDPVALLKTAQLGNAIRGSWNKWIGSWNNPMGKMTSGLVGGLKGIHAGGLGNFGAGAQQGVANYKAENARQAQVGKGQLAVAGAQLKRNVTAPINTLGSNIQAPIAAAGAYLGGGAGAARSTAQDYRNRGPAYAAGAQTQFDQSTANLDALYKANPQYKPTVPQRPVATQPAATTTTHNGYTYSLPPGYTWVD